MPRLLSSFSPLVSVSSVELYFFLLYSSDGFHKTHCDLHPCLFLFFKTVELLIQLELETDNSFTFLHN